MMRPPLTILVVEDDESIRLGVAAALEMEGAVVHQACDGRDGLDQALKLDCDLVLLDLVLPHRRGLDILREVRASRPALPVIILTALGQEAVRVAGLELGADDYVVKPFSVRELLARVQAVLRRSPGRPAGVADLELPECRISVEWWEVLHRSGRRAELTEREAALLHYLATAGGRVVSRDEILQRVWRLDPAGLDTRTVDMTVVRLREKLGDDPGSPSVLRTVRGMGYAFITPDTPDTPDTPGTPGTPGTPDTPGGGAP